MKFVLVLVVTLALGYGAQASSLARPVQASRNINDDLAEFVDLLPLDQLLNILLDYLADPEFQDALIYLFSDDFVKLILDIEKIPQYNEVIDFIEEVGLPIKDVIKAIHDFLGISRKNVTRKTGGLKGLFEEILAVLDLKAMEEFYNRKMQTSKDFKKLFDNVNNKVFLAFLKAMSELKEIQRIAQHLVSVGIDVDHILRVIGDFFGIH